MVRNILGGIGILAVAGLVVSALSAKGTGASTSAPRTSASRASAAGRAADRLRGQRRRRRTADRTGQIGSYFDVQDGSGDIYQVALVKVVDPGKSADQFVTLQHGNRLVGIVFKITALTGSPQGEDANNDCTVLGTDGAVLHGRFRQHRRIHQLRGRRGPCGARAAR